METFTIREAAERCAVSYQAMRRRVDRGSLQALTKDGVRRIPRSELERAGLWPGTRHGDSEEVSTLRRENERLRSELVQHRQLTERAAAAAEAEREARERMEDAFHRTRAERQAVDQAALELRAQLEEIASAGPIRALRLRRKLRPARTA